MNNYLVWCAHCQKPVFREKLKDAQWAVHLHKEAEGHDTRIFVSMDLLMDLQDPISNVSGG